MKQAMSKIIINSKRMLSKEITTKLRQIKPNRITRTRDNKIRLKVKQITNKVAAMGMQRLVLVKEFIG